jgi:phytoene dehydrogenase-like protein
MSNSPVVIIGGGHNGLVAAAYLAKSGKKVIVLERRHVLGGCACTENLWPGFKVSPSAYVISLFLPQIIEELKLKQYGLNILPRNPSSFTPDLDGPGIVLSNNALDNYNEISMYSKNDAERYEDYEQFLTEIVEVIEPILSEPPPHILPIGRKIGFFARLKEMRRAHKLWKKFCTLGDKIPDAVELLTGATTPILDRWFESEILKTTLATDAIIGSFTAPSCPGSAYVLLHHVMGEAGGARGVWGYVQGGMGGLSDSLEKVCLDLGVKIHRNAEVTKICVDNGKVAGVEANLTLAPGTFIEASAVASSIDANWTFEKFIEPDDLPDEFLRHVRKIDYASASAKVNLALDSLPEFVSGRGPEVLCGTVHISPSMGYIEQAYHDAMMGKFSSQPVLEITIPSTLDNTLAPEGQHVMSIFTQYAPRKADWTDDLKNQFFEACMDMLEKYSPTIRQKILHHQVLTPLDFENTYRLTGGNIFQGAMSLHQLGPFRGVPGWGHRTPIEGLYVCGSAVSPGGGVLGACGKNGAEAILKD